MKRVIATVGTNPVPVLAACRRLVEYTNSGELVLLCSFDVEQQAEAILSLLRKVMKALPASRLIRIGDATSPKDITEAIQDEFLQNCHPEDEVYFHYTGGTKAMGHHVMKALAIALRGGKIAALEDSYLDPTIHQVLNELDQHVDPAIDDERKTWNLEVGQLAALHGLTHRFEVTRHGGKVRFAPGLARTVSQAPNPSPDPLPDWAMIAWAMAKGMVGRRDLSRAMTSSPNGKRWNTGWPSLPNPANSQSEGFIWPDGGVDWNDVPTLLNSHFDRPVWREDRTFNPAVLSGVELESVSKLCSGGWLEVIAWDALRQALNENAEAAPNFRVHSSTQFARHYLGKFVQFELDVVAVLGYQLLVVSCSASADPKIIKQKGFEALHRAWQVGGQGARVIVLGLQSQEEAEQTALDLQIDLGGMLREPIQVWGTEELGLRGRRGPNLVANFRTFLSTINWK